MDKCLEGIKALRKPEPNFSSINVLRLLDVLILLYFLFLVVIGIKLLILQLIYLL